MTTAALGVLALRESLIEQLRLHPTGSFSRRFQKRLAKVIQAPWLMATGEDYRYLETDGAAPRRATRFMHWYMDQVLQLATRIVPVRKVLLEAFSMLTPPASLFQPRVLFRVLLHVLKPAARPRPAVTRQVKRIHIGDAQVEARE